MNPIVTALDLPAGSPGGSVELLHDLYGGADPLIPARLFMLHSDHPPKPPVETLRTRGKCLTGHRFWTYVHALSTELTTLLIPRDIPLIHLQHLAFGATPALLHALPQHPSIALVHGTDLLIAGSNTTQRRVLHQSTHRATAIVVPTPAMADRLLHLTPDLKGAKIEHIPWGIPDRLLDRPLTFAPHDDRPLKLLYAGRLTAEKGVAALATACAKTRNVTLSIAAPAHEYAAFAPRLHNIGCRHRYLGWLDRHHLWNVFGDHDVLALPSTTLEAFGLVAVEAQACSLPVLYQPVPGLIDVLGDTALQVDFTDPHALTATLQTLQKDPSTRTDLRRAGYANAHRFPITTTATALTALGHRIT
ncbi:hypothetical protein GCM10022419_132960 [Nonomuraea rosea]|uniref:Glycosyltransferase n=1 Tax=Nonomuraea rosea TaxID=638574 RepID=A0ABP7A4J2_9ACTN